ncbi:MAG: putative Ig domain-containing protein [Pseudomonadota bacterium]
MHHQGFSTPLARTGTGALRLFAAALLLSACGGSMQQEQAAQQATPAVASASMTFELGRPALPDEAAVQLVQPSYHLAPALLAVPDDPATAERLGVRHSLLDPHLAKLGTRRLTIEAIEAGRQAGARESASLGGTVATPLTTSVIATYSPAQIRAAYGLPVMPAVGSILTATQAAQMGAGQTVYIVDAYHDPNMATELAAFNTQFHLPACTGRQATALPLGAASTSACELVTAYSTAAGGFAASAPAFDANWAIESALDVQWVHAIAPLARIVLIEAGNNSINELLGSIQLANAMGPGVVSMSFGANEASWTSIAEPVFAPANMSYVAATGDSGAAVSWPAVSPKVLAVGGTTLTYSSGPTRSEVGWSRTGGGTSVYTATPAYQNSSVPGLGSVAHRTVGDVAFNADPATGQYVAVIRSGSSTISWLSAGGTSVSAPQWGAMLATANALRAQASRPVLGAPHTMLYGQIAGNSLNYASAFADIVTGSDGTCAACFAKTGYDQLTGLGSPNGASMLNFLSGAVVNLPPTVTAAAINGTAGTALSFSISARGANPLSYALGGAPSGMTVGSSTGTVSWAAPIAGSYSVTATATDSRTALSGSAVYTVTIVPPPPPVVTTASVSGRASTPLMFTVAASGPNPLTYSLSGAPAGMVIGASNGALVWPNPVAGNYAVTAIARDSRTGLSGRAVISVSIAAATPPVVAAAAISGRVGAALSFTAAATGANPVTFTLSGAPLGLTITSGGAASWAAPTAGNYSVTVRATDTRTGLIGSGVYTVTIAAAVAPSVTPATVNGRAGAALSFTISASGQNALRYAISGAPAGMSVATNGTVTWAAPVAGSYSVTATVTDSVNSLFGRGVYTVVIAPSIPPPVLSSGSVSGQTGTALTFTVTASAPNPVSYTLSGAPVGMTINSSSGVVMWASPVGGSYTVTVVAKDNTTGLTGQGVYTISVSGGGPVISAPAMTGVAGQALVSTISVSDATSTSVSLSISGAPIGMRFMLNGMTVTVVWLTPVAGNYTLLVKASDSAGRAAQANVPVTISAN